MLLVAIYLIILVLILGAIALHYHNKSIAALMARVVELDYLRQRLEIFELAANSYSDSRDYAAYLTEHPWEMLPEEQRHDALLEAIGELWEEYDKLPDDDPMREKLEHKIAELQDQLDALHVQK